MASWTCDGASVGKHPKSKQYRAAATELWLAVKRFIDDEMAMSQRRRTSVMMSSVRSTLG